jgi:hypothetical protein
MSNRSSVEAEARLWQILLVGGVELAAARLGEVATVDRRREAVDVVVTVLLRLVEARPAGEHDIGAIDEFLLVTEQMLGRELELRQLVHRVIDRDVGRDVLGEGQHHRRVIPGNQLAAERRDMRVEQALQRRFPGFVWHAFGKVGNDEADVARVLGLADLQICRLFRPDGHRFLPVDDRHLAGKAAHQMLRPLEHKVPPQVRKAQQCRWFVIRRRGLGFRLYWHPDASQHFRLSSVCCYPPIERAEGDSGSATLPRS